MDLETRVLKTSDIPMLVQFAGMLHMEVEHHWSDCPSFNPEMVAQQLYQGMTLRMMHAIGLFCGENAVGAAIFTVYPCFGVGCTLGKENMMYVIPEHRGSGLKLISAFEAHAKAHGAELLEMGHFNVLNGEKMCRLYSSLGYELFQLRYLKRV